MSVYGKDGTALQNVYGRNGDGLAQAYDVFGNPLIQPSPAGIGFTVMTYNVQWFSGLNANKSMQESILETYNADIIGLQELTRNNTVPAICTELLADYAYFELGGQYNKTALASKYELTNPTKANFNNQASETRGYQKAYIKIGGKTICWVNTHLETSSHESVKVAQAQEVFNLVQNEEYFIITGDFNTVCKATSDTEYTTIMKQFIDAGYHTANCSTQHGFIDTWTDGKTVSAVWYPCDHIITSGSISIDQVIADTTKISTSSGSYVIDHIPLIANLTIN